MLYIKMKLQIFYQNNSTLIIFKDNGFNLFFVILNKLKKSDYSQTIFLIA